MSRLTKSEKIRNKTTKLTLGDFSSLDRSREMDKTNMNLKDICPSGVKLALLGVGFKGSMLKHNEQKLRKTEEAYKSAEEKYQMLRMPSARPNGPSSGAVFEDTFHRIMQKLKMDRLKEKMIRNQKAQEKYKAICSKAIGAVQSVGRLADTSTRKSAYSAMTGRSSDFDIPTSALNAVDTTQCSY